MASGACSGGVAVTTVVPRDLLSRGRGGCSLEQIRLLQTLNPNQIRRYLCIFQIPVSRLLFLGWALVVAPGCNMFYPLVWFFPSPAFLFNTPRSIPSLLESLFSIPFYYTSTFLFYLTKSSLPLPQAAVSTSPESRSATLPEDY